MILIDTSVWLQLQHRDGAQEREELLVLLGMDEVALTGMVVAEVLQGAKAEAEYERWAEMFSSPAFFDDTRETWERAGKLSYELRRQGKQMALSDIVIAVVAIENGLQLYANDSDFDRVPGLRRYLPSKQDQGR